MNLNSCSNAVHTRYVYAEHCYMNSNSYTACTCFLHIKVVCFRGTKWSPCLHTHPKISQIHHIQLYPIKRPEASLLPFRTTFFCASKPASMGGGSVDNFLSCPRQTSAKESEKSSVKLCDLKNPKEANGYSYKVQ